MPTTRPLAAALLCWAVSVPGVGNAACWVNTGLSHAMQQIASERFPQISNRLPDIQECDDNSFPPNVGGWYNPNAHVIQLPLWQRRHPDNRTAIAHELAHAQVAVTGGDMLSNNGHSVDFYRALIAAGYPHEAERVARIYGNVDVYFAAGGGRHVPMSPPLLPPPPVARWVTVCRNEVIHVVTGHTLQYQRSLWGGHLLVTVPMTQPQMRQVCAQHWVVG